MEPTYGATFTSRPTRASDSPEQANEDEELPARAARLGAILGEWQGDLAVRHDDVDGVRSRGLTGGTELADVGTATKVAHGAWELGADRY